MREIVTLHGNSDAIVVTDWISTGNGTLESPWILNESLFYSIFSNNMITQTRRTILFPTGHYKSENTIELDFYKIYGNNSNSKSPIIEGLKIIGNMAKIQFNTFRNVGKPSFWIHWGDSSTNVEQISLFFWEISGLDIAGIILIRLTTIRITYITLCICVVYR